MQNTQRKNKNQKTLCKLNVDVWKKNSAVETDEENEFGFSN